MGNYLSKTRLILLLIFLVGCGYFYQMRFDEILQKPTMVTQTTVTRIRTNTQKRAVDFIELSRDLREYSSTHNDNLEEQLFPWWLHRQSGNNSKQYYNESKGIVICTGNKHFRFTLVALSALAFIKNELPIEVVYSNPNDLSIENRHELQKSFSNIRLIDLSATSFNDSYLKLRGWEIKPFAVLASRFRHVLLMDADVLFLEKPSILFGNSYYLETGTLFFYDRPNFSHNTIQWMRTFLTDDNNNQSLPQRTQESGVVLIDKGRVLTGLLSICKLNDLQEREEVTYRHLHGDKDTWWLGLHLVEMPYSFMPTLTAAIGEIKDKQQNKKVCGLILHLDENFRPIWWNGGALRNKYVNLHELLIVDGWLYEGKWQMTTYSCVINTEQSAKQFTKEHQQLINGYLQITKMVFNIS